MRIYSATHNQSVDRRARSTVLVWQGFAFRRSSSSQQSAKMEQNKPVFDYHEESQGERLARKSKESPFMILGIAGLLGAVGFGAYGYKNRGAMSTSVYLMQFRVISQGAAVAALTLGMGYTLYNNHFNKPKEITSLIKGNEH